MGAYYRCLDSFLMQLSSKGHTFESYVWSLVTCIAYNHGEDRSKLMRFWPFGYVQYVTLQKVSFFGVH